MRSSRSDEDSSFWGRILYLHVHQPHHSRTVRNACRGNHYGSMMTRPSGFALSAKSWASLAWERGKARSTLTSISRFSSATNNSSIVERIRGLSKTGPMKTPSKV